MARPYARAAFDLAREAKAFDQWSGWLQVASAIAGDPASRRWNGNPELEPATLAALYRPEGVDENGSFGRFLAVLAENGRLALLPEIAQLFEKQRMEAENRLHARLRCAVEPDGEQIERLKQKLTAQHRCEIELEVVVDPNMIGGAVLDVGDRVIDGSLHARLTQLQTALMR